MGSNATRTGRSFHAHPSSLSHVRDWVRRQSVDVGLSPRTTEELVLAVNEAAANAVLHSGSRDVTVNWRPLDEQIEVEIRDEGVFRRRVRVSEVDGPGGYGIPLMMSLADEVLITEGTARRPGTSVRLVKRLAH